MKKFIRLISIFTLVFLSSMSVYAAESTSLSMEDLDTAIYEELLTEFYGVEEGYAYCSIAVNVTSNSALTDSITVGIPDAVGTNVWRVSTELTEDSNVSAVQFNNSYYYLYPVLNPEFTNEGVSFQTDKLGIFIAGGCLDGETLESFTSSTSLFSIDDGTYTFDGTTYDLADGTLLDNDYATGYLFSDGRLIVTAFKKKDDASVSSYPWDASKRSIKKISFTDNVTNIGDFAFFAYKDITGDLIIPDSVTSIGRYAFKDCTGFNGTLTLSNRLQTIDNCAFEGCSSFTGDLVIPDSVTSISMYAFNKCSGFNGTLTLSNNLSIIENGTFGDCSGLTGTLTLPTTVTSIGDRAFWKCSGFTGDLTIPNSVTSIGMYAFYSCSGFTSLTISNKISTISESVFYDCSGFTGDLIIPNSVTAIGDSAFEYCSGFNGILNLPDSIISIGSSAFYKCAGLTGNLVIPNTVTSIGDHAFWNCSGLTGSLVIPDSVTFIGKAAFQSCSGFAGNLTLPNSITEIQEYTFSGCSGFTGNLVIPSTVTSIGKLAFSFCSGFDGTLTLPNALVTIDEGTFKGCVGLKGALNIPDSVTTINDKAFYNCPNIVRFEYGNNVTTLGTEIFYTASETPTELVTSNGLLINYDWATDNRTILKEYTLNTAGDLKGLLNTNTGVLTVSGSGTDLDLTLATVLGDDVSTVQSLVFEAENVESICDSWCKDTSVSGTLTLPESLVSIGNEAFYGLHSVNKITIGGTVTSIGTNAFYVDSVEKIATALRSSNTVATQYNWDGDNRFVCEYILNTSSDLFGKLNSDTGMLTVIGDGTDLDIPLHTALDDKATQVKGIEFQTTNLTVIGDNWCKDLKNIEGALNIPSGVVTIGAYAFYKCGFTGDLVIPNSVTSVGEYAFCQCRGFTGDLVIPNSVTIINTSAFYMCTGFDGTLTLGSGLKEIGDNAFYSCDFTGDLILPDGLNSVGRQAFYNCNGFGGNLTIPDSVTIIDEYAFAYCSSLRGQLVIPSGLTTISSGVFSNCYGFTGQLIIPDKITSIGDYSFINCINIRDIKIGTYKKILKWYKDNSKLTSIGKNAFYSDYKILTSLDTKNSTAEGYDWTGSNRLLSGSTYTTYLNTAQDLTGTLNLSTGELVISGTGTNLDIPLIDCIGMLPLSNFTWQTDTVEIICDEWCSNFNYRLLHLCFISDEYLCYPNLSGPLILPNSIKSIGNSAFALCKGFTGELDLPDTLVSISVGAFMGCEGLTGDLTIPETVTSLGESSFAFCSGLNGVLTIPDIVTSIGNMTFSGCNNIENIVIGSGVESIVSTSFACTVSFSEYFNMMNQGSGESPLVTTPIDTVVTTSNSSALSYDWASDMRNVTCIVDVPLSTTGDLMGQLNTSTGELKITGDGKNLDIPIENSFRNIIGEFTCEDDVKLFYKLTQSVKTLNFEADKIEIICNEWCRNNGSYNYETGVYYSTFSNLTGDLVLPDSVKVIGNSAFENCKFNGTLTLPNNLTEIKYWAFCGCTEFTGTLSIPETVTTLGERAFYQCSGFTGDITIPNSVTSLGYKAFMYCTGFDGTLTLSNSIDSIAQHTFNGCTGLTGDLVIPGSVKSIGAYAFLDCTGFNGTLLLENGVETIDTVAFIRCSNLTKIVIPDSVTAVGSAAFTGCDKVTHITIGTGLTEITSGTFSCSTEIPVPTRLKTRNEVALNYDWSSDMREVTQVIQKYTLNTAGDLFGYLDTDTYDLSIEGTGKNLDKKLYDAIGYENSENLKSLAFNTQTVESICDSWCAAGTLSFIQNDVRYEYNLFKDIGGELILPNNLKTIGDYAFRNCGGMHGNLVIPEGVTTIGKYAFYGDSGFTGNLTMSNSITSIGDSAFSFCKFTGNLILSSSLQLIDAYAFQYCTGFTGDLIIPDSVTSVGKNAFYGCSGFNGTLTLSNNLTEISQSCFTDCRGFRGNLVIPEGVTTIGMNAFSSYNSSNQMFADGTLTLPNTITDIGAAAFKYCKFKGTLTIPENVTIIKASTFSDNKFNKIIFNDNLTEIGNDAFWRNSLTGDLVIPYGVTTIGGSAFSNNENISNLIIPNTVTTIGDNAFSGCYGLNKDLVIPNSVELLGKRVFSSCTRLSKIYIGSGITSIGAECFKLGSNKETKLYTTNQVVLDYDWASDNRTVVPMNTFTVTIPEEITLKPKYVADSDAPIWYTSFNMEVTGDFENGSYGVYEKLSSFTIKTEDGETRTVTTNIEDATVNEKGTITVPVELTAPDPTLLEEFTGELKLNTVLHEMIPFAA